MAGELATFVESLARAVRSDAEGRHGQGPARAPELREETAAPGQPDRGADGELDLWKEPVPVMEDRDGHLHLLI